MRRRLKRLQLGAAALVAALGVVGLLLLVSGPARADPGIVCVAPGGVGCGAPCGGTCYASVQEAVDAAVAHDEIRVAAGIYTGVQARVPPSGYTELPASGTISQAVLITKTVTVKGGYTTAFAEPPNPVTNRVVLDAQGQGRVLVIAGEVSPTVEGLWLTGGDAAGLRGHGSSDGGGGVHVQASSAIISASQIQGNRAEYGGALLIRQSAVVLAGNVISDNTASERGGGVYVWDCDDAMIQGNLIVSNTASIYGGGMMLQFSDVTVEANTIISNYGSNGSGVHLWGSDATFASNVIADNRNAGSSHGLYALRSSPRLWHTTLARNRGSTGYGVYVVGDEADTVEMTNTILVGHDVGIGVTAGNTAVLEATLWGTGTWANGVEWSNPDAVSTGTLAANYWLLPGFVDAGAGDYHLTRDSDAIDRGMGLGPGSDIDGDPRSMGSGPELGADEIYPELIYLPFVLRGL